MPGLMQKKALCRIYVGSLDYYLTEEELKQVFSAFGTITAVDMPKEGNRSKGFCFLEYSTPESADMAIKTMQGFQLKGRTIKVGRPTAVGAASASNISAALPPGLAAALPSLSPFAMSSPAFPTTPNILGTAGGTPGGGLAASQAGALAAAALLGGGGMGPGMGGPVGGAVGTPGTGIPTNLGGPPDSVANSGWATSGPKTDSSGGSSRIYVGNVPFSLSSEDVKQIFEVFGTIVSCQLMHAQDGSTEHRGYGFLEYSTPAQSKLAIDTMNGFEVAGKQLKVNYATALRSAGAAPHVTSPPPSATGANSIPLTPPTPGGYDPIGVPSPPMSTPPPPPPPPQHCAQNLTGYPGLSGGDYYQQLQQAAYGGGGYDGSGVTAGNSSVIMLCNLVSAEDVDNDLMDEVKEECSKYGEVVNVYMHTENSKVKIFVTFTTLQGAATAVAKLNDRWFGGRQIMAYAYPEQAFATGDFSAVNV